MKRSVFISKWSPQMLIFRLALVLLVYSTKAFSQEMVMSPKPPLPALTTSLPPQQTPLPSGPSGVPLKQGYFQGKDGVQLFYRMVGKGKDTIVFVHGGPGLGIEDGALDIELLAMRGYTFIEYDQRGGARSELVRDTTKLTMNDHVMDLEALRRYFKLQKLSLIGLSWGASIITYYYNQFPEHVRRLVFLSPMPVTTAFGRERRIAADSALGQARRKRLDEIIKLMDSASDTDLPLLFNELLLTSGTIYVTDSVHLSRARGSMATYSPLAIRNRNLHSFPRYFGNPRDFRPLLKNINVPSIVIEGEKTVVPLNGTRAYADNIKGAKLILIPDAGHQNWLDQPEAVLNALDTFFKSTRNQ